MRRKVTVYTFIFPLLRTAMLMKKFYVLFFILMFSLISCSKSSPNDDPAFAPVINPEPHYFMTVKGFIDPTLEHNLNLKWDATFFTTNPDCEYVVADFEGVSSYRTKDVIFPVSPDTNGYYEIKIPLDYFLEGKCKWKIQDISYTSAITGEGQLSIVDFSDNRKLIANFIAYKYNEIICLSNRFDSCHYGKQNQYDIALPRNNNYVYQLNIIRRKE